MPQHLDRGDGIRLAWDHQPGNTANPGPTIVFLPGFRSHMRGDKAEHLAAWCRTAGHAFLRLDYSGHGESGGRFEDGTIGRWTADALAVIDHAAGPGAVLVGSSMGGWIALLVALARPGLVSGLLGIAAAPDFTERLGSDARETLMRDGVLHRPSAYGEPVPITRALIEDGHRHRLLHAPIPITAPVRLLHGQADPDVPWQVAIDLAFRLHSADIQTTLIKDGDHRLSRPVDLALLTRTLESLLLGQDGA